MVLLLENRNHNLTTPHKYFKKFEEVDAPQLSCRCSVVDDWSDVEFQRPLRRSSPTPRSLTNNSSTTSRKHPNQMLSNFSAYLLQQNNINRSIAGDTSLAESIDLAGDTGLQREDDSQDPRSRDSSLTMISSTNGSNPSTNGSNPSTNGSKSCHQI